MGDNRRRHPRLRPGRCPMIGTAAERAALMAAVEQYGIHKMQFALSPDGSAAEQLADDRADHYFDAIRAMLAPDDAVVIPRALARSVYSALAMAKGDIAKANADAILEILQPEVTP